MELPGRGSAIRTVGAFRSRSWSTSASSAVGRSSIRYPNFLGPLAHGTPEDRFFYLSWGTRGPTGGFAMFRRLKVRLGHLGWPAIRHALRTGKPMTVTLRLTDEAGGPLCATPPATHVRWDVD